MLGSGGRSAGSLKEVDPRTVANSPHPTDVLKLCVTHVSGWDLSELREAAGGADSKPEADPDDVIQASSLQNSFLTPGLGWAGVPWHSQPNHYTGPPRVGSGHS